MTTAVGTDKTAALEEERPPMTDTDIDDALDDSFPASDPPSWWAGADRPST